MRIIEKKIFYPAAFNSATIREHLKYEDDLKDLIEKSGVQAKFWGLYKQRLTYLDENSELCTLRTAWFEQLIGYDGELFSMIIKFEKNIRILFTFVENEGTKYTILLYPFQEKESGKTKQSYKAAAPIALKRLNDIREGLKNV
jgi:hypothetical protein